MARLTSRTLHHQASCRLEQVWCDGDDCCGGGPELPSADGLVVVLHGRFEVRDRRRRVVVSPATAFALAAGHELEYRHRDGQGDVCLSIRGAVAAPRLDLDRRPVMLSATAQAALLGLARRLRSGEPADPLEIEEPLWLALEPSPEPPARRRGPSARERELARAIAHALALRSDQPLTVAALAAEVGASPFHACRVFRTVAGTSIHRHLTELRLRHALAMVLDTGWPLARVAVEAGFANEGHLCNRFRHRYGVTPGAVRRGTPLREGRTDV